MGAIINLSGEKKYLLHFLQFAIQNILKMAF